MSFFVLFRLFVFFVFYYYFKKQKIKIYFILLTITSF